MLFFLLSSIFILGVILCKNPIYSLLNLIMSFLLFAFLFIFNGLEFIGILTIFVYVGAISILFLFVIMFLEIRYLESNINNNLNKYIKIFFILFIFFGNFLFSIRVSNLSYDEFFNYFNVGELFLNHQIHQIGFLFYNNYCLGFIIAGIVLLIAMISVISITSFFK